MPALPDTLQTCSSYHVPFFLQCPQWLHPQHLLRPHRSHQVQQHVLGYPKASTAPGGHCLATILTQGCAAAVTLYNLCNATTAVDIDATLTVPADCSCFDVTQSGVHGISFNADPTHVTLFQGSGCQAGTAVPAANNAQCFMGHYERPSTDAYCDSFCASAPALSNGLFSMKICPGEAARHTGLCSYRVRV